VGGPGYNTVAWSTGDTNEVLAITQPGTYTITADILPDSEDGCVLTVGPVNFTMRDYEPPTTSLTLRADTLWASPLADSYQWFVGTVPITGWNRSWYVPTKAAAYRVVTRSRQFGNCASESEPFQFAPTDVEEGVATPFTASWQGNRVCVRGVWPRETISLFAYDGTLVKRWVVTGSEHCEDVLVGGRSVYFVVRTTPTTPGQPFPGVVVLSPIK
jgi:hypothetical protein